MAAKMTLETANEIKLRAVVEGIQLGDRCAEVLASIVMFQNINGYSPTIRELAKMNSFTSNAPVQDHLATLERFKVIDRIGQRAIQVLKPVKLQIVHPNQFGHFRRKALSPVVPVVKSSIVRRPVQSVPVRSLDW